MQFQRLVPDNKYGFNYDYMGYAEYECGGLTDTRTRIASAWIENDVKMRPITIGNTRESTTGFAIGHASDIDKLPEAIIGHNKGFLGIDMRSIIGWMGVAPSPQIIIVREYDPDRLETFLKPTVEKIRESKTS